MTRGAPIAAGTMMAFALALAPPAMAQDAAETAIITAGTGAPQARGARSLGSAISDSMNRAAGAIRVQSRGAPLPRRGPASQGNPAGTIAADVDVLENTDAPGYRLGNGATIRVSGRLNPAAGTVCTRNCPGEKPRQASPAPDQANSEE